MWLCRKKKYFLPSEHIDSILCAVGASNLHHSSHFSGVDSVVHDWNPSLECGHLEERDVGVAHVVEGYAAVNPLGVVLTQARLDVGDNLC